MYGHAMFAMDDLFANLDFKTHTTLAHDSFELLVETPAFSAMAGAVLRLPMEPHRTNEGRAVLSRTMH